MTPEELMHVVLGTVILTAAFFLRPQYASCPPGSYVEGVGQGVARPRGSTHCAAVPDPERPEEDCRGARACHGRPPRWTIPMQIVCTNGQDPIVVDDRTVGCQARH